MALVPAWWAISRSEQVRRNPIRYGYLIGLIYFGGVFWWISNVTAIGTFFLVLYLALYPAIWFLLVARFIPQTCEEGSICAIYRAMAAAALWVTLEWWRSWFLTGFNWNELGVSQAPSIIFRQLAAFGGVHLISFVLVTVNILWAEGLLGIAKTFREKRVVRASVPFAAALFIVAGCFALGWHHLQRHQGEVRGPELRFACVQPNIPQLQSEAASYREEALDKMEKMTVPAIATHPDLLLWPEAIIGGGVWDHPLNEAIQEISQASNGYFLLGAEDYDYHTRKLYNCAFLYSPGGEEFEIYRKTRLVILGEFLPWGDWFPWIRTAIGIGIDFTPGDRPQRFVMSKPKMSFAPLICFEDTLPEVANKAARLNPDFFVTITNDGWYWGLCADWGIRQHLNHAIFRCIEHDRPMLRCANTGVSCVIDANGSVVQRYQNDAGSEIDVGGVFSGTLAAYPSHETVYEAWGDWIVLISALFSLMLGTRFCYQLFTL